jgi:hypothetical protein
VLFPGSGSEALKDGTGPGGAGALSISTPYDIHCVALWEGLLQPVLPPLRRQPTSIARLKFPFFRLLHSVTVLRISGFSLGVSGVFRVLGW